MKYFILGTENMFMGKIRRADVVDVDSEIRAAEKASELGFDLIQDNAVIIAILKTMVEADIIGEAGDSKNLHLDHSNHLNNLNHSNHLNSFNLNDSPNSLDSLNNSLKSFSFESNLDELNELNKSFDESLIKTVKDNNSTSTITSIEPKTDIDNLESTIDDLDNKKYYLLEDYIDKDVAWGVWSIKKEYQNLDISFLTDAIRALGIFSFLLIYCDLLLSEISYFPLEMDNYSFLYK